MNVLTVFYNEKKNVEGKKMYVEHKGSLKDTLIEMEQNLQSPISYADGTKLSAIRNVDYVIVKNSIVNLTHQIKIWKVHPLTYIRHTNSKGKSFLL